MRALAEDESKELAARRAVLDGTDDFATRFAVNRACVTQRNPVCPVCAPG